MRFEIAQLLFLFGSQEYVAQFLGAAGAVMDAAEVDASNCFYAVDEPRHARDVPCDQNAGPRIASVARMIADGRRDIGEVDVHLRRNGHAVQLLLPVTRSDDVVDENEKASVERLAPADNNLSVNQPIVDPVQIDSHQVRSTTINEAFPLAAAERAASIGDASVLNTKSRSVARLTPLTSITPGS